MTAQLATRALRSAIARREPKRIVTVHSDRGGQFRSRAFRCVLVDAKLAGSMGRVASAGDNAAMESFLSLLQKNVLDRQTWATRDELRLAIVTWTERTYNRRRRQRRLGKLTPGRVRARPPQHRPPGRLMLKSTVNQSLGRPRPPADWSAEPVSLITDLGR